MKIIIANWKAYVEDFKSAEKLFGVYKLLSSSKKAAFVVAPPNIFLRDIIKAYKGRLISFASQGVSGSGACTACTSVQQVKDTGVDFVLVGHSEQRARSLTDEQVSATVKDVYNAGMYSVIIVGENNRDEQGGHFKFVRSQLKIALNRYPKNKPLKFIVAYEPVWAVGAKQPPKAHEIEMMMIYIRKILVQLFGDRRGRQVPILYGGSVNAANISAILELQEVSGVLLGRASVDEKALTELYQNIKK